MTSHSIPGMRWRHAHDDVNMDVTKLRLSLQSLSLTLVAKQLLWAYLQNRMVDFAHFRQANWYDRVGLAYQNPRPSDQYLSLWNIFSHYHGNRLEFSNSDFARLLSDPERLSVPDFVKIGWETAKEMSIIATTFALFVVDPESGADSGPHHAKTGLKILSLSYQKEGFADTSPAKPSFGMTPAVKYNLSRHRMQFSIQCYSNRRFGRAGASQAFIWYGNDKNLKACFSVVMLRLPHGFICFCVTAPKEIQPC